MPFSNPRGLQTGLKSPHRRSQPKRTSVAYYGSSRKVLGGKGEAPLTPAAVGTLGLSDENSAGKDADQVRTPTAPRAGPPSPTLHSLRKQRPQPPAP